MATVKISNLPSANQNWNLDEIIPVVDSGSTVTSKRTYKSLFSNDPNGLYTINSTDQTWAVIASSSSSPQTHIRIGGINNAAVISSRGANISSGQMNTIIGSEQNSDSDQPNINGGQYNTIIGSKGGVQTNGNYQMILNTINSSIQGGENNTLQNSNNSFIGNNSYFNLIGASQNASQGYYAGGGYKVVTLGSDNGNIEQATEAFVAASRQYTSHLQGSNTMSIIASKGATIEPVSNAAEVMSIWNSKGSTLKPNQHNSVIIDSDSVSIDDSSSSNTQISAIINGWGGGIIGNSLGGNYQKMLINTYGTQITHGGSRVMAINANGGTISATGDHNMLINTESIDITGSNNKVTKIGVWDTSHTTQHENTTHTDNLHTYNTESFDVIDAGNVGGSINVDCSLGTIFTFTMTADTTPNFINIRNGQRFIFIVYNNSNWSVPTATVNGAAGTVYAKNGTINPTNSGFTKYMATYDNINGVLWLDEELGFASV